MAATEIPFRTGAVEIGDTIVFMGRAHIVASLERRNRFGWSIADCADGWSIALGPDGVLSIPTPTRGGCCVLATGAAA